MTIIGVDVDAAVEPTLTLFSGNKSAGSGVSGTFLNIHNELVIFVLHNCPTLLLLTSYSLLLFPIDLHSPICHLPLLSGAVPTRWCRSGCSVQLLHHL